MLFYSLNDFDGRDVLNFEFISFFSEVSPLGVIGSFVGDRIPERGEAVIKYKHRLLYAALDNYYMLRMLEAIGKREVLSIVTRLDGIDKTKFLVPLKILLNRQNGREYAACYDAENSVFTNCRLDQIVTAEATGNFYPQKEMERLKGVVNERLKNTWNVNFYHHETPQKVELVIHVADDEPFILTRLQREGHGGNVEYIGNNQYRYRHAVYDPSEMIPWLKSFMGRIVSVWIEDEVWNDSLHKDIQTLITGGDQ